MSARLKLKKLKLQMEALRTYCKALLAETRYEKTQCYNLLQKNIREIEARAELHPIYTYRDAKICLDTNVHAITNAIVREYTDRLSEYVYNELSSKYRFNRFETFSVRLLAPALNEEHIKIEVQENQE